MGVGSNGLYRHEAVVGSACDTVGVAGNGLYRPEKVVGSA